VKLNKSTILLSSTFLFFIYLVKELNFLFYNSLDSPDFDTYSVYFEYLFNNINNTGREQGLLYYYLHSWYYYFFANGSADSNLYTLLHKSIQEFNFILFIIGLLGIYRILIIFKFSKLSIFLTLMTLNLIPLSVALRIVFKPEILTFALLPWIVLCIEKYKHTRKITYIYLAIPLVSASVSSKGSIAAMLLVSIFLIYFKDIITLGLKKMLIFLALLFSFLLPIFNEDTKSNGLNIVQLESGSSTNSNYDFKAPKSFVYNLNGYELVSSPIKNKHADSFISITLLDTFGDYYDLFWDNDSSLYFKNRVEILKFEQSDNIVAPKLNVEERSITFYLQNITDTYYRKVIGLILSIYFYFLFFLGLFKDSKYRKFYFFTLISITLLLIHVITGFPINNFNPEMGDTLKPLYYSPFLLFTCVFLFANYFEKNNKNKIIFIFFIPLIFVVFGFPKTLDSELERDIAQINNYSFFCEFNKEIVFQKLTKESTCVEGPVVRQLDYEFMNIESYNNSPRFKPLNTILIVTNIVSLLILIFNKSSKKIFAINGYKKQE
tara:strand:+ start:2379 stop:4025 length:1647 start_codon:yes stop_codon:yes gene_type:complete